MGVQGLLPSVVAGVGCSLPCVMLNKTLAAGRAPMRAQVGLLTLLGATLLSGGSTRAQSPSSTGARIVCTWRRRCSSGLVPTSSRRRRQGRHRVAVRARGCSLRSCATPVRASTAGTLMGPEMSAPDLKGGDSKGGTRVGGRLNWCVIDTMKGGGPLSGDCPSPWPRASTAQEPTARAEDSGTRCWTRGEALPALE